MKKRSIVLIADKEVPFVLDDPSGGRLLPPVEDISALDMLDIRPKDLDAFHGLLSVARSGAAGGAPLSLSVVPERGGHETAAEMFAAGLDAGIRTFNLPNPRLVNDGAKAALANCRKADLPAGTHTLPEALNSVFMGTAVISGSARAMVCRTGTLSALGEISHSLGTEPPPTAFEVGTRRFGLFIMRFTVPKAKAAPQA